jgi:hypothetical protein
MIKAVIAIVCCFFLYSCAFVRVYDKETGSGFSSVVPAWPWQDSSTIVGRMNLSVRTNGAFTASIRELNQDETTNTNMVNLIQAVAEGAVIGTMKALKP